MELTSPALLAAMQNDVVILLHDVNRKVEQSILEHIFPESDPSILRLGVVLGHFGDLAAIRVGRPPK